MSITRPLLILMIGPLAIAKVSATEPEDRREDAAAVEQPAQGPATAAPGFGTRNPKAPTMAPYQAGGSPALLPPGPVPGMVREPRRPEPAGSQSTVPRWLEEVRAQRRALRDQRRAAHQARLEALDPIGAAKRDERKELMRRRQEEMRELIETERLLYLNRGPWFNPLFPRSPLAPKLDPLAGGSLAPQKAKRGEQSTSSGDIQAPSDWNNLWYYHGW